MEVHLYTICWNEADILPFFFRHYDPWVDRYVIFDNGSSDNSLEILTCHPRVELRKFAWSNPDSFVLSSQTLHNQVWKESRGVADWVVITAVDEHLCVPGQAMRNFLTDCSRERITLVPALGYQMVSEEFPGPEETLCLTRTCGAPWGHMNKLSLFDPNALDETNFETGRHKAVPAGRLKLRRRDELLLLHFKLIGFERTLAHHARERTGLRSVDLAHDWGRNYAFSRAQLRERWDTFARRAVDISNPHLDHHSTHLGKRWWRSRWFNQLRHIKRKLRQLRS